MLGASILGGAALGILGQERTNQVNKDINDKNLAFQNQMSSTAYQRGVKDLKAAGLNPALAYGNAQASSPSGSTTKIENPLSGVTDAMLKTQSYNNAKAVEAKTKAETQTINEMRQPTVDSTNANAVSNPLKAGYTGLKTLYNKTTNSSKRFGDVTNALNNLIEDNTNSKDIKPYKMEIIKDKSGKLY